MRIAVTGACGELGGGVVAEFLAHGYEVIAIDRARDHIALDPRCEYRMVDLADPAATQQSFGGCAAIIHLAAIPNPRIADAPTVFANNTQSVFNVLHAAVALGIKRVVYASSQSALGNSWASTLQPLGYIPVDENYPGRPLDPYGLSKFVGEQICAMFSQTTDIGIASLRFPAIWLPSQFERRINGRLTDQLQAAKSMWAYVDVRDAARACRLAFERDVRGHDLFNITARWAFGAASIPELLKQWYPTLTDVRIPLEAWSPIFDWRKADRVLGFQSHYRWTQEGISQILV